ncbi:MAG TPA: hypothetical protein VN048_08505, partial [Verrucomicrobiae bacterium]|nr:hypothetical protein [Verrucomicrobiae bacterium]
LLVALILGGVGVLCTHDRRDVVPGLLFGLPAIIISLMVIVLFVDEELIWVGIFALPSLIMGALVVWRGIRTGQKRSDYFCAMLVCIGIFLMGFVLVKHPDITRMIFSHILPAASIL